MKNFIYLGCALMLSFVLIACTSEDDGGTIDDASTNLVGTWEMTGNVIVNGIGTYALGEETVTNETTFAYEEDGNVYTVTFSESGEVTENGGFRGVLTFNPDNGGNPSVFDNYSVNVGNEGYELLDGTYATSGNQLSISRDNKSYDANFAINGSTMTISFDMETMENEIFQDYDVEVVGTHVITLEKQE